jgi:hypothetical protein
MATYHGIAVNFGVSSSLNAITGAFQTRDHSYAASNESVSDGAGSFIQDTTYGDYQTATFEYVATGTGTAVGNATVTVPTVGASCNVADVGYPALANSYWIVRSVDVKGSNTSATRVTCNLWRSALITS